MNFLSLTDNKLDKSEIDTYSETIERFIIDIQHIITNVRDNKNMKPVYLDKFKTICDIVSVYNDSKITDILHEYKENNEMNIWNMMVNSSTSESDEKSDSDNVMSDSESKEDEFHEIYIEMIDSEYNKINKNSVLKQYINVIRVDNVFFNET